jgi:hypothetical protein
MKEIWNEIEEISNTITKNEKISGNCKLNTKISIIRDVKEPTRDFLEFEWKRSISS